MKKINLSISEHEAQALLEDLIDGQDKQFSKIIKNLSTQLKEVERKEIKYTVLYLHDLKEQELFDLWVSTDGDLYLCNDMDGDLFVCDIEPKDIDEDKYLVPDGLAYTYSFGYIECDGDGHHIDLDSAHSLNSIEMPHISTEDLKQMLQLFEYLDQFRLDGIPE